MVKYYCYNAVCIDFLIFFNRSPDSAERNTAKPAAKPGAGIKTCFLPMQDGEFSLVCFNFEIMKIRTNELFANSRTKGS